MRCKKCSNKVELNDKNTIFSFGKVGNEKVVEIEVICDKKKCGNTVGTAYVGVSEFNKY